MLTIAKPGQYVEIAALHREIDTHACWLGTNVHFDGGERAGEGERRKRTDVRMFELV